MNRKKVIAALASVAALASLAACGGVKEIHDTDDFNSTLSTLLNDKAALKEAGDAAANYIAGNAGAADAIFQSKAVCFE